MPFNKKKKKTLRQHANYLIVQTTLNISISMRKQNVDVTLSTFQITGLIIIFAKGDR